MNVQKDMTSNTRNKKFAAVTVGSYVPFTFSGRDIGFLGQSGMTEGRERPRRDRRGAPILDVCAGWGRSHL